MYLDISHPDVIEFLEMRKPTGDQNTRCLNLHNAINISDKFMELIEKSMADPTVDDSWELIDPASKEVREVVSAKALWQKLLILRMETGEPYLNFIDTVNNALPEHQKKLGLTVKGSNLCLVGDTEIEIMTMDGKVSKCNLEEFVNNFQLGYLPGVKVKTSVNDQQGWSDVTAAAATGTATELYEIETPTGNVIKCTPEHQIYTRNRGFVQAQHLTDTDELLEI
jgi:ribonucleoside-diphosphate reductase alpha chain